MSTRTEIFCDGACSGNPGVGGFGCILRHGSHEKELSAEMRKVQPLPFPPL